MTEQPRDAPAEPAADVGPLPRTEGVADTPQPPVESDVPTPSPATPVNPANSADPATPADPASTADPTSTADDEAAGQGSAAATTVDSLPDVTADSALAAALEALLLVVDSPATEESLAESVAQPVERVTAMLRSMSDDLTERGSGMDLRRSEEGWRLYTRDTYAPFVEKLLLDGQRSKLTRAALETLAVVAYRQPVTRARVAAVRGVNVDGVVRTLLARGLIEEAGADEETGGTLYATTELFLERLGLSSLGELPPIAPLLPEVDTVDEV